MKKVTKKKAAKKKASRVIPAKGTPSPLKPGGATKDSDIGRATRKTIKRQPALDAWLKALDEHGFFQGPTGAQEIAPTVAPVIEALHQVLAGGTINPPIVVIGPINSVVHEELNQLLDDVVDEVNRILQDPDVHVFFG